MKITASWFRGTNGWWSLHRVAVVVVSAWLVTRGSAGATDFYWTNTTTTGNFTNSANWFTNGVLATTVPGAADNANFTNLANAYQINWTSSVTNNNAFFNSATNSTITIPLVSRFWLLTNSFIIGQSASTTATVSQTSGTILVTNASGTGLVVAGDNGKGSLFISSTGKLAADQIMVGRGASGVGTVTFSSGYITNGVPGSTFTNLIVGSSGSGTFTQSGATTNLTANLAIVGLNSGGTGTVTHTGGLWVLTNATGTGTLILGAQSGAVGSYTLNGAGAALIVDKVILATNAGSGGAFNWTTGSLTVNSLGVDATNTNVILKNLIGTSLGSNSSQTVTYGVSPDLVYNSGLILGQTATGSGALGVGGGTFTVTNAGGNAALIVGQAGKGSFILSGGNATVDQLLATNVTGGVTNSFVQLNSGTLTILHGSSIVATNNFNLGGGSTVTVNILGGTNVIVAPGSITLGNAGGTDRAIVIVSGPGTLWSNSATAFNVGLAGAAQNQLVISNGAHVVTPAAALNANVAGATSQGNTALVAGSNTVWDVSGPLIVGSRSGNNQLTITNGAVVNSSNATISALTSAAMTNNTALVSGPGSRWNISGSLLVGENASIIIPQGPSFNSLTINNGGVVTNLNTSIGGGTGSAGTGVSNYVAVTGAGSVLSMNGDLFVGYHGSNNYMTVSDGGTVSDRDGVVGRSPDTVGSTVLVTGGGSLWQNLGTVYVGSNGVSSGNSKGRDGKILVQDGGTLEANNLTSGFLDGVNPSGIFSNSGGIYQFTKTNITITANSANSIVLNSGTISFKGVTNANIFGNSTGSQLTNMTFLGDNAFRLNGSSNATGVAAYTFATGNPTNYAALQLVNDVTLWRSTTLTIGGTGKLLVSNTTATVAAAMTLNNGGSVQVVNSSVRYASNVTISGGYVSDPSTNIFSTNTTVTASGFLAGGPGDLFQFERNLTMQSTNASLFDLKTATVLFTNGTSQHTLDLTGSWAMDRGSNFPGIASIPTNFAIGTLILSANDTLLLTGALSNALYVGALDFGGLSKTNDLTLGVNLYYDMTLAANSYLGSNTFDLAGAGMLIPYPGVAVIVPEPSALLWLVLSAGALVLRRRSA